MVYLCLIYLCVYLFTYLYFIVFHMALEVNSVFRMHNSYAGCEIAYEESRGLTCNKTTP